LVGATPGPQGVAFGPPVVQKPAPILGGGGAPPARGKGGQRPKGVPGKHWGAKPLGDKKKTRGPPGPAVGRGPRKILLPNPRKRSPPPPRPPTPPKP